MKNRERLGPEGLQGWDAIVSVDPTRSRNFWAHSSLGNIPPREFAVQWQLTEAAGGEILNLETA